MSRSLCLVDLFPVRDGDESGVEGGGTFLLGEGLLQTKSPLPKDRPPQACSPIIPVEWGPVVLEAKGAVCSSSGGVCSSGGVGF